MNEPVSRLPRPAVLPGGRVQQLKIRHVCRSYFPHFRTHQTTSHSRGLLAVDAASSNSKLPGQAPAPVTHLAEQLTEFLKPAHLRLACHSVVDGLHNRLQTLCNIIAATLQQAKQAWQLMVVSWPAWQASLIEDVEYVLEYAVGVFPIWIASLQALLRQACIKLTSIPKMQQMAGSASDAARDLNLNLLQLQKAVGATQQMAQRRLADVPPLQEMLRTAATALTGDATTTSSSIARGLTHSMAALTAAELAAIQPAKQCRSSKRFRGSTAQAHAQVVALTAEQTQGSLQIELNAVLRSSQAAARSGLQHLIVEPLQHAGFIAIDGRGPTLAGIIAAASVLLAGSVYRSMRRNAEAAEERLLQQVQLQMKAESLAAQRARFRRALGDAQVAAAGGAAVNSRRRTASPADADAWEDTIPASSLAPAGPVARATGSPRIILPQLDAAAAREYQRFMAGAKAMDVPMWDSHMTEDLPKVSMKELQRQTQKIRSAATADERAAMEDAELRRQMVEQQLNSQLQELSGAPVGRTAREAWRREQQQRKAQEQQAQAAKRAASVAEARSGSRLDGDSNPFAISKEARAQWEAEDHIYSEAKPRPRGSTGWDFGFGSKQQQPQQPPVQSVQQQVRRRHFADGGEKSVTADPSQQTSKNSNTLIASVIGDVASQASARHQAVTHKHTSPVEASAPAPAPAGPAEGTPEWEAQIREEMLRSAAARRARRQQLMQQHGAATGAVAAAPVPQPGQQESAQAAGGSTTIALPSDSVRDKSTAAVQKHALPVQSLNRPKWPGTAAAADDGRSRLADSQLTVLGQVAVDPPNGSTGGGRLSLASARDVQDITASPAAPSPASMQRLQAAAAGRAEAAAEARAAASKSPQNCWTSTDELQQEVNPFAVDKAAVLDDEEAFELGKQVDQDTRRIRLDF